jgi:peptide/nickel transport system permease protein
LGDCSFANNPFANNSLANHLLANHLLGQSELPNNGGSNNALPNGDGVTTWWQTAHPGGGSGPLNETAPRKPGPHQSGPHQSGLGKAGVRKRRPWWVHPSLLLGGFLTGTVAMMAALSLIWTPYDPTRMSIRNKFAPPSLEHWFGTDQFGRDVLSIIMSGAQTSIVVGLVAVLIGMSVGVSLGLLASARRGWVEELVMRLADFMYAFPAILLAILLVATFGSGTINAVVAIGIFAIPTFARLTRGAANAIWVREYILAAKAAGRGPARITLEHVLPNIAPVLVVQATVQFALAVLAEAALSYLGIGSQPPTPSWGRMLSDAQTLVFLQPMLAVYPGVAIAVSVLGLNLLGDGLRDLTDPRLVRAR